MSPKITPHDDPTATAVAKQTPDLSAPPGPVDGDWAQRERAAKGQPPWDDAEDDRPYGDPGKVKDEGPLESLGKAVTAPIRDAAEDEDLTPDKQ
jgi:hypothetical protein